MDSFLIHYVLIHFTRCHARTQRQGLFLQRKEAGNCSKAGCKVEIQQHEECEAFRIHFYSKLNKKEKQSLQNGKFVKKNSKYLEYSAILNKMGVVQGIQVPVRAPSPRMQHPCCASGQEFPALWQGDLDVLSGRREEPLLWSTKEKLLRELPGHKAPLVSVFQMDFQMDFPSR